MHIRIFHRIRPRALARLLSVLAFALPAPAAHAQFAVPPGGVLLDSYAAVANGKVITVGDVLSAIQSNPPDPAPTDAAALDALYRSVRDDLVARELILQEFDALGATLPERAIEDHVNSIIHDRFRGDRTAFLAALAAERTTYEEWRREMLRQLTVQIMRQREVDSKIAVTPVDVQAEYDARPEDYAQPERVRLAVWSTPRPAPSDAAQIDAVRAVYRALLTSVKSPGADPVFPDPDSLPDGFAPRREELPSEWLDADELAPAFAKALAPLTPPAVPRPVRLGKRLYFLRLLDRTPSGLLPLEEAAPAISAKLRAAERKRLEKIWIDSLRAKYHVQYYEHDLFDDPAYGADR